MTEKKSFRASCKEQRHEEELCGARSITEQSWGDVTLETIHTSLNRCKYTYRSHMTFTCEWSPLTCERFIHRALLLFLRVFFLLFLMQDVFHFHLIHTFDRVIHKQRLQISAHNMLNSSSFTHVITFTHRHGGFMVTCEMAMICLWMLWCGFLLLLLSGTEKRTSSDSQNTWCEPQSVRLEVYQFSITNGKENVSMSLEDL